MSPSLHRPITHTELVVSSLARWPAREAFRQDGRAWSYAETADLVSRFAALFQQRGLARREGVGVLSPNRPEVWMSQTATNVAGGRYTALHPMGSLADHRYACNEAELRFLCVDPTYAPRAGELLESCPSLRAVFTFGSRGAGRGSARRSRAGIVRGPARAGTERARRDELAALHGRYHRRPEGGRAARASGRPDGDERLGRLGPAHGAALPRLTGVARRRDARHATLLAGGTTYMLPGWDPAAWIDAVERHHITVSLLVPTMIYSLLDYDGLDAADRSSLETIMYGASPMAPARLIEGLERIGPVFCQLYGQTECAGIITSLWRHHHDAARPERLASCGQSMPGVRVSVRDDAETPFHTGHQARCACRDRAS